MPFDASGAASAPRLNKFTLRFADTATEAEYRAYHVQSVLGVTRFGLLLAAALYVFYGVVDHWVAPEHVAYLWSVRAVMLLLLVLAFAASWRPFFFHHQQALALGLVLLAGLSVCALLQVMPLPVMNQQKTALVLVIIGGFTLMGLQFLYTVVAGVLLLGCYLWLELALRDNAMTLQLSNIGYIASAALLSSLGAYATDKHRRLAWSARRQIEQEHERFEHLSLHDPLTGLPNRRLLLERLAHAVARDNRYRTVAAVLFIDLDRFKDINDAEGHAFGDAFLQAVGVRLRDCVRNTDTVSRFGGDEFVVLLEDLRNEEDVRVAVQRIEECFAQPVEVDGRHVDVPMSIGQALHPRDGADAAELLGAADRAMYGMKRVHGRR